MRDVDTDIWYALYAPAETPADIISKLMQEKTQTDKTPTVKAA